MARQYQIWFIFVILFSFGSFTTGQQQETIDDILNGALQTLTDAIGQALQSEHDSFEIYIKKTVDSFNKAGVKGNILGANYQANIDLNQALLPGTLQHFIGFDTLTHKTLANIYDCVKRQTSDIGIDVNAQLAGIFQVSSDEKDNIFEANGQELIHILNQAASYAMKLNQQSREVGADINYLEGLLNDLMDQLYDQFMAAVAQRHQEILAIYKVKCKNQFYRITQIIQILNS